MTVRGIKCFSIIFVCFLNRCYLITEVIIKTIINGKEVKNMAYTKPEILAQSTVQMAVCRPSSKQSGRPCNPPGPSGR
jgi:hypothetical protein